MSDPYLTLGVPLNADDASIHTAYLAAIKQNPPERDVSRFEAIRNAYEAIRNRKARLIHAMFDSTLPTHTELLDKAAPIQETLRPKFEMFAALMQGDT